MRKALSVGMVLAGLGLMLLGFFLAAPWGASSVGNADPRMPFAPAVFVVGVIFVFSAALVYELLPDRSE